MLHKTRVSCRSSGPGRKPESPPKKHFPLLRKNPSPASGALFLHYAYPTQTPFREWQRDGNSRVCPCSAHSHCADTNISIYRMFEEGNRKLSNKIACYNVFHLSSKIEHVRAEFEENVDIEMMLLLLCLRTVQFSLEASPKKRHKLSQLFGQKWILKFYLKFIFCLRSLRLQLQICRNQNNTQSALQAPMKIEHPSYIEWIFFFANRSQI